VHVVGIPSTVQQYLDNWDVTFDVVAHPYAESSLITAAAAHVSGEEIAKSVVLEDNNGYVIAMVPATHHIHLGKLTKLLDRQIGLATEPELADLFDDCDLGAIPPFGQAYGIETVWDDALLNRQDIYFESGDHRDLIHVDHEAFKKLMTPFPHGSFSYHL
jgi:Ala-tRNA(Pro) deacylase